MAAFAWTGLLLFCCPCAALQQRVRVEAPRVVVLLRGISFRVGTHGHAGQGGEEDIPTQERISASHVRHLIEPLEALGFTVDVDGCTYETELSPMLASYYGNRVVGGEFRYLAPPGCQITNALCALEPAEQYAQIYESVYLLRFDLELKPGFGTFGLSASLQFGTEGFDPFFLARRGADKIFATSWCEEGAPDNVGGELCSCDLVHQVPQGLLLPFVAAIKSLPAQNHLHNLFKYLPEKGVPRESLDVMNPAHVNCNSALAPNPMYEIPGRLQT